MRQGGVNHSVRAAFAGRELDLPETGSPLDLETLVPGSGPWEVEVGFGKGRYLLSRAQAEPEKRFLGIEMAGKYYGILRDRSRRRGVENLLILRGEAALILGTVLPRGFASVLHVYFPDPWPKSRHHRRRLFDPSNVDLLLGILQEDADLFVATDHPEYGPVVEQALESHPSIDIARRNEPWPDGARTNYEAKYEEEGRPILRLQGKRIGPPAIHPAAYPGLLAAWGTLADE